MVSRLQKTGSQHSEKTVFTRRKKNLDKTVVDFETESSSLFFPKLSVDSFFLELDPSEQNKCSNYQAAKECINTFIMSPMIIQKELYH